MAIGGTGVTLRLFLAGKVAVDSGDRIVDEATLPGLQGRIVFAMLAAERERSLSHDELAEELWPGGTPSSWEAGLKALVSKLRTALSEVGLDGHAIAGAFRLYQLKLPADAWIDLEAAADALHRAETLVRKEQVDEAAGWALGARAIASRPLLEARTARGSNGVAHGCGTSTSGPSKRWPRSGSHAAIPSSRWRTRRRRCDRSRSESPCTGC